MASVVKSLVPLPDVSSSVGDAVISVGNSLGVPVLSRSVVTAGLESLNTSVVTSKGMVVTSLGIDSLTDVKSAVVTSFALVVVTSSLIVDVSLFDGYAVVGLCDDTVKKTFGTLKNIIIVQVLH